MLDKFLNLPKEKRDRIIKAALREFASRGYKEGKTDNIVREAGISKGLLFHYFGTKKDLFMYLFNYAVDIVEKQFNEISMDEDIFERIRQNTLLKLEYYRKYPDVMNFGAGISIKGADELQDEISSRMQPLNRKIYASLYEGLDLSRFKDSFDPQVAINIIMWTLQGLTNKITAELSDGIQEVSLKNLENTFPKYIAEVDVYLTVLKKSFYKQGGEK